MCLLLADVIAVVLVLFFVLEKELINILMRVSISILLEKNVLCVYFMELIQYICYTEKKSRENLTK